MALPNFSFTTTAEEVVTVLADEIQGKSVLITGTSLNGIGFETACVEANYANLVIITGHNVERLNLAEGAIKNDILAANIQPLILDLSSLSAVCKAATEINAIEGPLHDAYNESKATNILCTIELLKRSKGQINGCSLHPKAIFTNIMQKEDAVAAMQTLGMLDANGQPSSDNFKTMGQGAAMWVPFFLPMPLFK
ncbi:hypothetical protein B0H14DRAFT_3531963 [Mycena olivaceomarginata]|nr:hypothetical protein B0H14DRAFT_3531963 [Mycena olivaceomarginata]